MSSPQALAAVPSATAARRRPRNKWRGALRDPYFVLALLILLSAILLAAFADFLAPGDPMDMVADPLLWPGQDWQYPLGTDALGRDLFAGLAHGARVSLLVGAAAAAIALGVGAAIGAVAGYFGGVVDNVLVKLTELFQSIPPIMLTLVILAIGGASIQLVILAIGISSWPTVARLVRAEFLSLREADFVAAARLLGYGTARIVIAEILPNALPTLIVATSVAIAAGILAEAGLSFLNLSDPNLVSWGSMIGAGRSLLRTEWYVSAIPGIAILLTVLSLNIIGDRLTDLLNPRAEQR